MPQMPQMISEGPTAPAYRMTPLGEMKMPLPTIMPTMMPTPLPRPRCFLRRISSTIEMLSVDEADDTEEDDEEDDFELMVDREADWGSFLWEVVAILSADWRDRSGMLGWV